MYCNRYQKSFTGYKDNYECDDYDNEVYSEYSEKDFSELSIDDTESYNSEDDIENYNKYDKFQNNLLNENSKKKDNLISLGTVYIANFVNEIFKLIPKRKIKYCIICSTVYSIIFIYALKKCNIDLQDYMFLINENIEYGVSYKDFFSVNINGMNFNEIKVNINYYGKHLSKLLEEDFRLVTDILEYHFEENYKIIDDNNTSFTIIVKKGKISEIIKFEKIVKEIPPLLNKNDVLLCRNLDIKTNNSKPFIEFFVKKGVLTCDIKEPIFENFFFLKNHKKEEHLNVHPFYIPEIVFKNTSKTTFANLLEFYCKLIKLSKKFETVTS